MKAEEMFKRIGYEVYTSDSIISYAFKNEEYYTNKKIAFLLKSEGLSVEGTSLSKADMRAIFTQCLELGWVEVSPKYKTNLDHYRDKILEDCMWNLALVEGKPKRCSGTSCGLCDFYNKDDDERDCNNKVKEWLKQSYQEPANKLTKFEYDLLQSYLNIYKHKFKNILILIRMKEKGYFKDVDEDAKIEDILADCEITEED